MSKTKLAIVVFCVAFGLNIAAFLFSHKTFMVEESKNVWMYELPLTESPLDAYSALDIGPHQAVVGTLFRPNHNEGEHPLQTLLADHWTWKNSTHVLSVALKKGITYGNGEPILAEHFVAAHEFLAPKLVAFADDNYFGVLKNSVFKATPGGLEITLTKLPSDFDLEEFMTEGLTHPLSGVIHPTNLAELKDGKNVQKTWITSGAYLISKWSPKEIELISRSDFPVGMQKDVLRTIKYQSAPIKNPSCDFLEGRVGDEKMLPEHIAVPTQSKITILWACRSFAQDGFCKDRLNRQTLAELFSGKVDPAPSLLAGKTLRYRIPLGSDEFRNAIRARITDLMQRSGGKADETSYFFKASKDTDLELEFVVAPETADLTTTVVNLAKLSTRFGSNAAQEPYLVGVIESNAMQIMTKDLKGESYSKLFLEPDLDQKKLPL